MNKLRFRFRNWGLLFLTALLLCSFQTTFWFQLVGSIPAPLLWLNLLLYLSLFRTRTEAVLINYFLGLALASYTSLVTGTFLLLILVLTFCTHLVKERIFWPSTRYFVGASFLLTCFYQFCILAFSYYFDPLTFDWNIWPRIVEILLTPLFAAPVYMLLQWVDRLTERESMGERSGGVLP